MRLPVAKTINLLEVVSVVIITAMALLFQYAYHDLPCPLCLLQRIGIICIGIGFILNLRFGPRPSHYALSIFAALFTGAVALRQTLLHIVPGSGGYGPLLLGLHMYTWVFILAVLFIVWIAFVLLFDAKPTEANSLNNRLYVIVRNTLLLVLIALIAINLITTLMECGLTQCPVNPTTYQI